MTTLAIDDPVLYYSCPIDYTAQCGFDVLAHASEPYVSRIDFGPSLGNALYAIELTAENLREAVWNPQSRGGREGMMYAQYIAAQAFNPGGLGIIHSISHAVSAFYDTHHGRDLTGLETAAHEMAAEVVGRSPGAAGPGRSPDRSGCSPSGEPLRVPVAIPWQGTHEVHR